MLNLIGWTGTIFLTVCKQKTALMLNWIVWKRTVYWYKNGCGIK